MAVSKRFASGWQVELTSLARLCVALCRADHLHTNFRQLYTHLRSQGYFIDTLTRDLTCFNALDYSALLLVDTEEDFSALEVEKLERDVISGLSLIVFADWWDPTWAVEQLRFRDDNTRRWWSPAVGGANIPSINELLRPFGIAFGKGRVRGSFTLDGEGTADFSDGTFLTRFPMTGRVVYARLRDTAAGSAGSGLDGDALSADHEDHEDHPVFGMVGVDGASSFLAAFGDSGCIDDAQLQRGNCFFLVSAQAPSTTAFQGCF